jgi:hypothetical protein
MNSPHNVSKPNSQAMEAAVASANTQGPPMDPVNDSHASACHRW